MISRRLPIFDVVDKNRSRWRQKSPVCAGRFGHGNLPIDLNGKILEMTIQYIHDSKHLERTTSRIVLSTLKASTLFK